MKKWLKTIKNEKGLTLIELLAVVVILGIIAAIAVPSISNIIDNSKKDAHVSNALLIINAARLAEVSNATVGTGTTAKNVKTELEGTNGLSLADLVTSGYLEAAPKDPDAENAYEIGTVKKDKSTGKYSITLKGAKINKTVTEENLNKLGRKAFDS